MKTATKPPGWRTTSTLGPELANSCLRFFPAWMCFSPIYTCGFNFVTMAFQPWHMFLIVNNVKNLSYNMMLLEMLCIWLLILQFLIWKRSWKQNHICMMSIAVPNQRLVKHLSPLGPLSLEWSCSLAHAKKISRCYFAIIMIMRALE